MVRGERATCTLMWCWAAGYLKLLLSTLQPCHTATITVMTTISASRHYFDACQSAKCTVFCPCQHVVMLLHALPYFTMSGTALLHRPSLSCPISSDMGNFLCCGSAAVMAGVPPFSPLHQHEHGCMCQLQLTGVRRETGLFNCKLRQATDRLLAARAAVPAQGTRAYFIDCQEGREGGQEYY